MSYYYTKFCNQCGQEFRAQRRDAKYCGATCRKAASRRKTNIEKLGLRIVEEIASLNRDRARYPDLAPLIDEYKRQIVSYAAYGLDGEGEIPLDQMSERNSSPI